jgi:hypothetical protein
MRIASVKPGQRDNSRSRQKATKTNKQSNRNSISAYVKITYVILIVPGRQARQHLVQQNAHGPPVNRSTIGLIFEQLCEDASINREKAK